MQHRPWLSLQSVRAAAVLLPESLRGCCPFGATTGACLQGMEAVRSMPETRHAGRSLLLRRWGVVGKTLMSGSPGDKDLEALWSPCPGDPARCHLPPMVLPLPANDAFWLGPMLVSRCLQTFPEAPGVSRQNPGTARKLADVWRQVKPGVLRMTCAPGPALRVCTGVNKPRTRSRMNEDPARERESRPRRHRTDGHLP